MFPLLFRIIFTMLIAIVTSQKQPGICEKPCAGGPFDICVTCPTPCPKTCTTPTGPQVCPAFCLENGCECAPGYLRENGQCILPSQCPTNNTLICPNCNGPNVRCTRCYNSCEQTCRRLFYPQGPIGPCLVSCGGKYCMCADGYYRGDDGECVSETDCVFHIGITGPPVLPAPTPICNPACTGGPNDKCVLCGTRCPLTCDNHDSPPICTEDCVPDVCQCDEGYVRASNGRCVLPNKCPAKINKHRCQII